MVGFNENKSKAYNWDKHFCNKRKLDAYVATNITDRITFTHTISLTQLVTYWWAVQGGKEISLD